MYKSIERFYKKNSPYSRIKRWIMTIYLLFIAISFVLNFYKKLVIMLIFIIIFYFIMIKICEKILKRKLKFKIKGFSYNENYLSEIIYKQEKELFKNYAINNNFYNEKTLLCLIEHFRKSNKVRVIGINLLSLLSVFLPVLTVFYTKDGLNIDMMINILTNTALYIFVIAMLYYSFNQFISVIRILNGSDAMHERLEDIFTSLYIDLINNKQVL